MVFTSRLPSRRLTRVFVVAIICTTIVSQSLEGQHLEPKSAKIPDDTALLQSFMREHLSQVLPRQKTTKNFPSGGLGEDIAALTKWAVSKSTDIPEGVCEPVAICCVLSGDFESTSQEKLNDVQFVKDEKGNNEIVIVWYYKKNTGRKCTIDICCTCLHPNKLHAVHIARSFDLTMKGWLEVSGRD